MSSLWVSGTGVPPRSHPRIHTEAKMQEGTQSTTLKFFLSALVAGGLFLVIRAPPKVAPPPAPPEKFLLVSVKIKLAEPNLALFVESSKLEKDWLLSAKEVLEKGRLLSAKEVQLLKTKRLIEYEPFENPDLALLLSIEGATNSYTDGRIHATALNQVILTTLKVPYKYKDRRAVFDLWSDKANHQTLSLLLKSVSITSVAGLPITVETKQLAELAKNHNARISQFELTLSESTNSKPALPQSPLVTRKRLDQSNLAHIHKELLIQDDYSIWEKRLLDKGVLTQQGDGYFLVIGNISTTVFVE